MYAERILPHDLQAEESVIGSLLIDGDAVLKVVDFLQPEDFFRERNRWAYEASIALFHRNEAIDQATVGHELARANHLQELGGYEYLSQLAATVPTSVNIEYYARIVQRTSVMRQLIHASTEIASYGFENPPDIDETLDRAEALLYRIRSGSSLRDMIHLRDVMDRFLERESADGAASLDPHVGPIQSGYLDLDQILGGLQRSDLVILAARPSLGKSSLALGIAHRAASNFGTVVGIFSLEMSSDQLGMRLLAAESRIDSHRLRLGLSIGHFAEAEHRRLVEASGALSGLPIYLDDSPMLSVLEIRSRALRFQQERGADLIIVDYLQLIQGPDGRSQNRVQEVSDISRSLKGLARDLNVPVLAVSQLSRAVENRPSRRPQLSDLRESGSIEQDADVVMFIHREDLNTTEEEWLNRFPDKPYPKNIAEIIIAKHRHGPQGTFPLFFQEQLAQFEEMSSIQGSF